MEKFDDDNVDQYLEALWKRREARKKFAEYIQNYDIDDGERIKMNVAELDNLMFEKFKIHDKVIKVIALEGDFLKKIDFSGISFDNVLWSANYTSSEEIPELDDLVDIRKLLNEGRGHEADQASRWYDVFLAYFNYQGVTPVQYRYPLDEKPINLSGINANIDFSKGYGWGFISSYNFSNIEGKLIIPDTAQFYHCDLQNMDLTGKTIKYSTEDDDDDLYDACNGTCLYFKKCNLKNTGATIELFVGKNGSIEKTEEQFYEDMKNGKFNGCYFNGEMIGHSKDDILGF